MEKIVRLQTECFINYTGLNSVLSEWYKKAITAYIQPEILANDIKRSHLRLTEAETGLQSAVERFKVQLQHATKSLSVFPVVSGNIQNNQNRKESVKAIRARLAELARIQGEMQSNCKINTDLCNQLQGLLKNTFPTENTGSAVAP